MGTFTATGGKLWDQRRFDAALAEYVKVSKKTLARILNTKGFVIASNTFQGTRRADTYSVRQKLGGVGHYTRVTKKGKLRGVRRLQLVSSTRVNAPLAALIVNSRRGMAYEKGLYGSEMKMAAKKLIGAKMASLGFLRSGWLPAISILAPLSDIKIKKPGRDAARRIGRAKGSAIPAKEGFRPQVTIVNNAGARRDMKGAWRTYGEPPLAEAFEREIASIHQHVEEKMKPDADAFNRNAS